MKEAPKTQPSIIPPPSPLTNLGLLAMPNLKKMRLDHELEEGEVASRKEKKQQKVAKDPRDKRDASIDSKDKAEVRRPQQTWDASRGHANYLVQALQQPLLLRRDMESIRHTR